jgi:cytochrome c553
VLRGELMSRRLSVKMQLVFLATSVGMSMAHAADIEAGRSKVTTVCAACHGGNGVSVSANIPNLAGQKAGYVTGQLEAFRAGKRKNEIMNAIANQLSNEDIENVSAFFASLPGAPSSSVQSCKFSYALQVELHEIPDEGIPGYQANYIFLCQPCSRQSCGNWRSATKRFIYFG